MAIILVAPKRRQRILFWTITLSLIGGFFIVSLIIFPPTLAPTPGTPLGGGEPFVEPTINFTVIDSDRVSDLDSLDPYESIALEFSYVAKNAAGKTVSGTLLAADKSEALLILQKRGLSVFTLKENPVGRSQPFVPYN